ncbi:MAG: 1,4-alpha-glucan branching protein GlgB [Pseudomonadales bacterium]|nr:1,4-alpha-glucan branching protein GlgB [Pseudomonadales bacterium]
MNHLPGSDHGNDHAALDRLLQGRHHAPFDLLGARAPVTAPGRRCVRVLRPGAASAALVLVDGHAVPMAELRRGSGLFHWEGPAELVPAHHRIRWVETDGSVEEDFDPYGFPPDLDPAALAAFNGGFNPDVYRLLGAHVLEIDGVRGTRFAVWAPNAERVSLVGDHNRWNGLRHPLQSLGASGVWSLFVPGVEPGTRYKYQIRSRLDGVVREKADPWGQAFEERPRTASVVAPPSRHVWQDADWVGRRDATSALTRPMSIYEVHLGSWRRQADGFLDYRSLAAGLAAHVQALGFTHVELLPVTEHPFDGSWGYQTLGYFAPTSRFGAPDDLRWFVDHLHQQGIGVLLDWVPAHFPGDAHGLARFDGTALFEHEDPRLGVHQDWDTLIFNYGRNEVRNFLTGSALYWLREFHFDGLRVDAVASMLYLDYSRKPGEWLPNRHGGNENLDAIDWLRQLNEHLHGEFPGVAVIAEESTAWPQVTRPTYVGGLGFTMKWNMGWMHDTLSYLRQDPVHRAYHHDRLTFGMLYAHSEHFVLPLSHDEVVHGKGSLLHKMPGDDWQKFANLRLLYCHQFTWPGRKLVFMGSELAQRREWDHDRELDWELARFPEHRGIGDLLRDLNELYRREPALHDDDPEGFAWIDCNDHQQSVISFLRGRGEARLVVILNFTPVPRRQYRIGVPAAGPYRELLNSDAAYYGGSNLGNLGRIEALPVAWMDQPASLTLSLPPLGALILAHQPDG